MPLFVLLTRYTPDAIVDPSEMSLLHAQARKRLAQECPSVKVLASYVLLGPYDTLNIVDAPDNGLAARAAVILRTTGVLHTEIWPALSWSDFDLVVAGLGRQSESPAEPSSEAPRENEVDEALEETFPASDPPGYA